METMVKLAKLVKKDYYSYLHNYLYYSYYYFKRCAKPKVAKLDKLPLPVNLTIQTNARPGCYDIPSWRLSHLGRKVA